MESFSIAKFQVTNFRNLENSIINLNQHINCIFGQNGNGKTNVLEALYVLANKKSFRKNAGFPQFLSIDGEKAEILFSSVIQDENNKMHGLTCKMHQEGVHYYLDGKPLKKSLGLKMILINPFDSHHFHNVKAFRRQWFDHHLCLMDSSYKKSLNAYNKALRFKNALLSSRPTKLDQQIKAIHQEMAKYAAHIVDSRLNFLKELDPFCQNIFEEIFSYKHNLKLTLDSQWIGFNVEKCFNYFQSEFPKEVVAGRSLIGPHRDDYILMLDHLNSFDYSSLGQQKMSYLSLLFAYIELFRYKFSSFPIVLIDDVSGELDRERWGKLIGYLETRKFQVLITTANEKFREELERIDGVNKLNVDQGSVRTL